MNMESCIMFILGKEKVKIEHGESFQVHFG